MGRDISNHSKSPVSRHSSRHKESPSRRERSPAPRHRSSHRSISPEREKRSSHTRSPSTLTKRLRRAQTEREPERGSEREQDRSHGRERDREVGDRRKERRLERDDNGSRSDRERGTDREAGDRRNERRLERDDNGNRSSRSRHGRSSSPSERDDRKRRKSRSPQPASDSKPRDEVRSSNGAENRDDEDDAVAKMKAAEEALEAKKKHKPSFELSGKLAEETNRVRGVTLLFSEPPEARKPDIRWRLYVFKGGEVLNEPLYIHRQSCYLFGRERRVADIPTDHPSCSKQHAVIQFRQVEKEQPDGMLKKQVKPYLMDLGSTNKTLLNDNPIEPQRYYELFERDTIKFGNSSREYVLLHENSVT